MAGGGGESSTAASVKGSFGVGVATRGGVGLRSAGGVVVVVAGAGVSEGLASSCFFGTAGNV